MSVSKTVLFVLAGISLVAVVFFVVFLPKKSAAPAVAESKGGDAQVTTGTATGSMYSDVIDNTQGFIIEGVSIGKMQDQKAEQLLGSAYVVRSANAVVLIKGEVPEASVKTLLMLAIPSFADGAKVEFSGEEGSAKFLVTKGESTFETGLISGSIRFIKKQPATKPLAGYTGELLEGTGEIEVVVSNINAPNIDMAKHKKYAARYSLPIVSYDKWKQLTAAL